MQARDLMSKTLVVVTPETPVTAVAELLAARGISAVPVADAAGTAQGIVTEGDLIRRLADRPPGPLDWFLRLFRSAKPQIAQYSKAHGLTARDVMSTKLVSVGGEASAEDIARLMEQHGIRRVLVLEEGKLLGIVSRADLLRAILRGPAPSDAATDPAGIQRALLAAMREQAWVDNSWVFPDVVGSVVTLYGYARSDEMRQGLVLLAKRVPGVTAVEDRMEPMPLLLRATL
ncbi:CBS domain-containing protein [Dankookia sp. GCM10030260]|uniref:CBS domain-containing protein n=1 Tax=Dankookia sp. GCM10030260 TaxID=3273390 RepID=UPI003608D428